MNTSCSKAGEDRYATAGPLGSRCPSADCTPAIWHAEVVVWRASRIAAALSFARISCAWTSGPNTHWHKVARRCARKIFPHCASGALYWSDLQWSYRSGCWSILIKNRPQFTGRFSSFCKVFTWQPQTGFTCWVSCRVNQEPISLLLRWTFTSCFGSGVTIWWAEI